MQTPHTPIELAPNRNYPECDNITDVQRHRFCDMVQFADALIGEIVVELEDNGLFENTVIAFLSDNGGATGNPRGQNLPLRGKKGSKFDGGVRTASFLYGGSIDALLGSGSCDYEGLFYINDWGPTLLQIASNNQLTNDDIASIVAEVDDSEIDGIGLWSNILMECGYTGTGTDDDETVREWCVPCTSMPLHLETYLLTGIFTMFSNLGLHLYLTTGYLAVKCVVKMAMTINSISKHMVCECECAI